VAAHVAAELRVRGYEVSELDLRTLPAEDLLLGRADAPGVREAAAAVARAEGVVLATPIYKAAYSGLLKVFLDLLPQFALAQKTVLPIATGGSAAHVLALDYALRPVLASLGARHVVGGWVVGEKQVAMDAGGGQLDPDAKEKLAPVIEAFTDSVRRHAS
jgi:FMN reductase